MVSRVAVLAGATAARWVWNWVAELAARSAYRRVAVMALYWAEKSVSRHIVLAAATAAQWAAMQVGAKAET